MMKDFTFRLGKATEADFRKSVKTAKVKEIISSEKNGSYSIEFYEIDDDLIIGVSHPVLLPDSHRSLVILRFKFSTLGDGLRVNGEYRDFVAYRPYLAELFGEIAKDWPDAQSEIQSIIAELTGQLSALGVQADGKFKEKRYSLHLSCDYKEFIEWIRQKFPSAFIDEKGNSFEVKLASDNYIQHWKRQGLEPKVFIFWFMQFEVLNRFPLDLDCVAYWTTKEPQEFQDFIALANNYFGRERSLSIGLASQNIPTYPTKQEPPAKKNKAFEKRRLIGKTLSPWLKQLTIRPTISACIAEIKKKPGFRDAPPCTKTMSKILDEYYSGDYEN